MEGGVNIALTNFRRRATATTSDPVADFSGCSAIIVIFEFMCVNFLNCRDEVASQQFDTGGWQKIVPSSHRSNRSLAHNQTCFAIWKLLPYAMDQFSGRERAFAWAVKLDLQLK